MIHLFKLEKKRVKGARARPYLGVYMVDKCCLSCDNGLKKVLVGRERDYICLSCDKGLKKILVDPIEGWGLGWQLFNGHSQKVINK